MTYRGHVQDGVVLPEDGARLPVGAEVEVALGERPIRHTLLCIMAIGPFAVGGSRALPAEPGSKADGATRDCLLWSVRGPRLSHR
jgi:hypothetical protein